LSEAGAADTGLLASAYRAHLDGREDEAVALYEQVLAGPAPQHGQAAQMLSLIHSGRGDRCYGERRLSEALAHYDAAVALAPLRAEVWNNRGVTLEAAGRLEEALESFERAVAVRADYGGAQVNRGGVLVALERWAEALTAFDGVEAALPRDAKYWNNRSLALGGLNRWAEAAEGFAAALALDPADAHALSNLSVAERRLGRLEAALASADRALAIGGDDAEALTTRGLALAALGRFDAALEHHERALAVQPNHLHALNNAGLALDALDRPDAALVHFDAALAQDPGFAEAEFNSALALLRAGRFDEGWRRHEARWRRKGEPGPTYPDSSLWLGSADAAHLQGRTILLHAEQGLGDTLQFCRYAKAVKALGARVILEVQPPLKALLAGLEGADRVIGVGEPVPPFDRHTPLLSLPLALGLGGEIPSAPYLTADPARLADWRTYLGSPPGLRVGFVWSGAVAHGNDRNRSLPASALAPLIAAGRLRGVQMVSLQKEVRADDRAWLDATPDLLRVEDRLVDFADTAALVATCDLVIGVDTSVAHLAGALGRPLWLLLATPCDWRWMSEREDTPWYPSARLFRQRQPGGWTEALEQAARALATLELDVAPA
jgi:tetratricopeptide (TPR) repeat protein